MSRYDVRTIRGAQARRLYSKFGRPRYLALDRDGSGIVAANRLRVLLLRLRGVKYAWIVEWHRDEWLPTDTAEIDYVAGQLEEEGFTVYG